MKYLLFAVLAIIMFSCEPYSADSYSWSEMVTFVATGEATETGNSLCFESSSYTNGVDKYNLPIYSFREYGYYPGASISDEIRYYKAK